MLVKRAPLDHICLDGIVAQRYEFESQRLEDRGGRYTMCEEIVEFRADLENPGWRVFVLDFFGDLRDERFPVRRWDGSCICDFVAATSTLVRFGGREMNEIEEHTFARAPPRTSTMLSSNSSRSPSQSSHSAPC